MGDGPEKITSQEELATVRALARRVNRGAIAAAIVATAPFLLLP